MTAIEITGIAAGAVAALFMTVEREIARIETETLRLIRKTPAPLPTARVVHARR